MSWKTSNLWGWIANWTGRTNQMLFNFTRGISHRSPTYQLHLSPKTRFGDPKNPLQGNAGNFREIQGFLLNNIEIPRERPIQGSPGNAFWGSQTGILGWFSWADENGQSWYVGHGGGIRICLACSRNNSPTTPNYCWCGTTQCRFAPFLTGEGQKGTPKRGREETSENVMTNRSPSPPTPFCQRPSPAPPPPLPLMSSEEQKRGKLVREVGGPKDKTNGRERDALSWHFLPHPLPGVPFWPSPISTFRSGDLGKGWVRKISSHKVRWFTEWPKPLHWIAFPVEFLTKGFIHLMPCPHSVTRRFSSLISASSHPLPQTPLRTFLKCQLPSFQCRFASFLSIPFLMPVSEI